MPLASNPAHACLIASGSCVGSLAIRRPMAWEAFRLASTFSLPIPYHCAGVLARLVRCVITCAEAAIISSQLRPNLFQAMAVFIGSFAFKGGLSWIRGPLEPAQCR